MADGPFRHYGAGNGQQYYYQQQQHSKHLTRSGSPVGVTRNHYSTDTPSPSRSPSHNQFNMFGHGQTNMMNGANGHPRYMLNNQHKYGQQSHQHQNQQHHHQQNHTAHANLGHQHTFSGGMNLAANQNYNATVHNESINDDQLDLENYPEHWQYQVQLIQDARTSVAQSHRHSRKQGAQPSLKNTSQTQAADTQREGEASEKNRVVATTPELGQEWESIDMSGQGLRVISNLVMLNFPFLTHLYIDNNKLTWLPNELGTLKHLVHLQASNNALRSLPSTIGMLSNLKELLVYDNRIDTLPDEMGFLFRLEVLGIEGNPVHSDIQEFIRQNGTKAYVVHLRDSAEPGLPPKPRPMITLDDSEASDTFTILDWNILCDRYVSQNHYPHVPKKALEWEYRRDLIIEEIKNKDADFLCIQEIDQDSYDEFFRRELAFYHYKGMFWQKARARTMMQREAKTVDGCAIFYKAQKFIFLDKANIDFANMAINRPDMKGEHDIFNRVMPRDHVAVAAFFENRMTGSRIIVANAHLFWDPGYEDVKVVQTAILLDSLATHAEKWAKMPAKTDKAAFRYTEQDSDGDIDKPAEPQGEPAPSMEYPSGALIPLLACGDFNTSKGTGVYDLISKGSLASDHPDWGGRSYGKFTREGISHPFKLRSAYEGEHKDYIEWTNFTPGFVARIDYIWHSTNLQLRKLLGDFDFEYCSRIPGFPSYHFPSDHLPLYAEFSVPLRKERKQVEANFGPQKDRRN